MSIVRRREQEVVISVRHCTRYKVILLMVVLEVNWDREFVCVVLETCELINKLLPWPAARFRPFGPVREVRLETLQRHRAKDEMLQK